MSSDIFSSFMLVIYNLEFVYKFLSSIRSPMRINLVKNRFTIPRINFKKESPDCGKIILSHRETVQRLDN